METDFSQRLMKARAGHGWSQADLAEVSGVAAAQISRYEAGRSTPRPAVVSRLAKSLGISFEWLAFGRGNLEDEDGEPPVWPSTYPHVINIEVNDRFLGVIKKWAARDGVTFNMALQNWITRTIDEAEVETTTKKQQRGRAGPPEGSKDAKS
jgi:transcriptional regulator with XRE-family HTH domain